MIEYPRQKPVQKFPSHHAHFYCSRDAPYARTPSDVLLSILRQLSETSKDETLPDSIREIYTTRHAHQQRSPTNQEKSQLIAELMSTERPPVIFIDGLDECPEPYELLKYLGVIIRNSSRLIKLRRTSRPNIEVQNLISLSIPCRQIDLRTLADLAGPTPNLSEVNHQLWTEV
jgi:hypothetical protein